MSFEEKLQRALKLKHPYAERGEAGREHLAGTEAAVLVLISLENGAPSILLTKRTETVESHKGQFAFPGGRVEPSDSTKILAALRETQEEVGIPFSLIRVLGELPELYTPTRYWINPIVGVIDHPPHYVKLEIDPRETAEAFWVPLAVLEAPGVYRREIMTVGTVTFPTDVYWVGDRKIWGATGAMLKNLLDRLALIG